MKIRRISGYALLILMLISGIGVWAKDELVTSGTWRYKITVVVETPEGEKSGFAVREMSNSRSKMEINFPQAVHPPKVVGEAVVVDLGQRGKLFALLTGYKYGPDHANTILYDVFPSGGGGDTAEGIRFYRSLKAGPKILSADQYPVLVMFKNINDPITVTRVIDMEPASNRSWSSGYKIKADHFEELFGKSVRLKEVTMEMTDEPVTWQVEKSLPWLRGFYNKHFDGQRFNTIDSKYRLANSLSSGAFSTGDKNDN